ncbi:tandem-95 repeat protein [Shewanella marinintestina]|uniref:Ig-like domain-containing protein n=1 Tax=Shewanella marinintestina TaxID=190305 RepID=UPI00200CCB59|nr:tandem-95 repeat protein [Shewanella marinintestina]MCL1147928.1 tandem-95 repeat protein [Shewanella marinintestina]
MDRLSLPTMTLFASALFSPLAYSAADVDFTGVAANASLGQPYVHGDFTFDQDVSGSGEEFIGLISGGAIGNDDAGNNSNIINFFTTDGSEFSLVTFQLEFAGGDDIYRVSAYRDNSLIGTESWDQTGLTGFQTFTPATSHFENIDEIRIGNNENVAGYILINLDNIDVSPAVIPNAVPITANLNGDSFTYSEGDGSQIIDQGTVATVTDGDSADFNAGNLTLTITSGEDAAEDILSIDTSGTVSLAGTTAGSNVAITGPGTIGTLANNIAAGNDFVINLNSSATPAHVQTLVQALTYQNSDTDNPTTGARNVRLTINDGDGGTSANADITVTVATVNDNPSLSNLAGDNLNYSEGDGKQNIDISANATVTDVDSINLNSGTLMVTIPTNKDASEDILGFDNTVTTTGLASASITISATNIGTLTNAISEGNDLTVTFNASATPALVQSLVRAITYENSDNLAPTESTRTVRFLLTDGDGGSSGNIDTTVVVSALNDLPVGTNNTLLPNEGQVLTIATADFGYSDPEGDTLNYITLTAAPVNGSLWIDSDSSGTINNAESALATNATISKANLDSNLLKYLPNGSTSSIFGFNVNDGTGDAAGDNTMTLTVNAQPTVTINQSSGQNDPTNNATVVFDVLFNESISGFDVTDINLSGDVTASVTSVSASSGTSFTVTTNISANEGDIIAQVLAGGVTDTFGATNQASTSTDNTIEYDITAPATPAALDMSTSSDTGSSDSDDITSDQTPEISGNGETGATLTLFSDTDNDGILDGGEVSTTTSVSSGSWSTSMPTLSSTSHSIKAFQTDAAGNDSPVSTALSIEVDTSAPSGHSVAITQNPVNSSNEDAISFTFTAGEVASLYAYNLSSSGGGTPITGNGNLATATDTIDNIDVSSLEDGTLNLSLILTDIAGNSASAVNDSSTKDSTAPTGHSVSIDQGIILESNDNALSFTFTGAEAGASFAYTINSSGGAGVNGTGTLASASDSISNIDVTSLSDGTLTLSVVVTDINGNSAAAVTDTVTKDALGPIVQSVALNTGHLKAGETITVSVQFDDNVILTGSNSTATLLIGGASRTAVYASGHNSSNLTFSYDVISGDNDSDGVTLTSVQSNSDAAQDANGNAVDFNFIALTETNLLVDTLAPASATPLQPSQTINADSISLTQTDYPEDGITIVALSDSDANGIADSNTPLASSSTNSGSWSLTLNLNQDSDNHFVLRSQDTAGNISDVAIGSFLEDSIAPDNAVILSPISPIYQSTTAITIEGSQSENGVSVGLYQDADNNGIADNNTAVTSSIVTANSWNISLSLADNTETNYVVIAKDSAGNSAQAVNLVTLTHDNIAPSADITSITSVDTTPSLTGTVTDAGGIASLSFTLEADDSTILGPFDADSFSDINSGNWLDNELADSLNEGVYDAHLSPVDLAGNTQVVTISNAVTIDTSAPVNYEVEIKQEYIDANNESALSFIITGGVSGESYVYQISDGSNSITGSGIISSDPQSVSDINVSGLNEGTLTLTLSLTDEAGNQGAEATDSVHKAYNFTPVITGVPASSVDEDSLYSFTPTLLDTDNGDTHNFTISNKPSWASFNSANGSLSGTPTNDDVGINSNIIISVTDSTTASASLPAFSIEVININDTPTLSSTQFEALEDTELVFSLDPKDDEGDKLTISLINQPQQGSLDTSGTKWTYQANENFHGNDNFTVTVSDQQSSSSPIKVSIKILPVNDAPYAQDDTFDLDYTPSGEYRLPVLANDEDIDEDILSLVSAESSLGNVEIENEQLLLTLSSGMTGDINLSYLIVDPDGESSQAEVNLQITPNNEALPTLTVPEAVSVQAQGLFTRVDLGVATAFDSEGEPLPVSLKYGQPLFQPGRHLVYWETTDNNGNTKVASQQVDVYPLVNFHKDQLVLEGTSAFVTLSLNGDSPQYPVVIDFVLEGNAQIDADYRLTSQQAVITSGREVTLEIAILNDEISESDEKLELVLDDVVNSGYKPNHILHIVNHNVAPQVSLDVTQNGEQSVILSKDGGEISITAKYLDINQNDQLSILWDFNNIQIQDLDPSNDVIRFDPTDVELGYYQIKVEVSDGLLTTLAQHNLNLVSNLPTLDNTDSDGDMIPDNIEGFGDDDLDGIANFMDALPSCNVQPESEDEQAQYLIEGEAGVCIEVGSIAIGGKQNTLLLDESDILPADSEYRFTSGVFDFVASGLPVQGNQYRIVMPLTNAIPNDAVYRKYNKANGWYNFVEDDNNHIYSTLGEPGYCPSPGESSWQIGLIEGAWCVQLTIVDGGPNDDDGEANFNITDPGGIATTNINNLSPEANDDALELFETSLLIFDPTLNDNDPEGGSLTLQSVQGRLGAANINNYGILEYQAPKGYLGDDEVRYTVIDDAGNSATALIYISVKVNLAPITVNDNASTNDRTSIIVDVLSNDIDSQNISLTFVSAEVGFASITADNQIQYTPKQGFEGVDKVTYGVKDQLEAEAEGVLNVTINAYKEITITNESSGGSINILALVALLTIGLFRHCKRPISILMFSLIVCSPAQAEWIANMQTGYSKTSTTLTQTQLESAGIDDNEISTDPNDFSWGIGIAYKITSNWQVNLGYQNLGDYHFNAKGFTLFPEQAAKQVSHLGPLSAAGFDIGMSYVWQFNEPIGLKVGGGIWFWKSDIISFVNQQLTTTSSNGYDPFSDISLYWTLSPNWQIELGWQHFIIDDADIDNGFFRLNFIF